MPLVVNVLMLKQESVCFSLVDRLGAVHKVRHA